MNAVSNFSSDAWLLHAILNSTKDDATDRNRIVAVADYYNHAVMTSDELESGLNRLLAGGWINREGFLFSCSEKARDVYQTIQREGLSCYDEMKRLGDFLTEALS
jgi:hypothetical protein